MGVEDQPAELRDEDRFDVEAVAAWLHERLPGLGGIPEVRQYPGGASNLTYLLRYPGRDLILRRPPAGRKAASAHDMKREFFVQQRLKPVYRYVPEVLALCEDDTVLGSQFYVMERLRGVILRRDLPAGASLAEAEARALSVRAVDSLIELHKVDPEQAGVRSLGKGDGYVSRQVSGWSRRYPAARTENVGDFEKVMRWLDRNQPEDVATVVLHNDFRLDNLVIDDLVSLNVIGVLDWEMSTLGDPLMDLGGALAYWTQADDDDTALRHRRQPTHLPGMLTRAQVLDYYVERTGFAPANWTFYEVFGLFRLAGIVQQIYFRYHNGQTTNPAFKDFWLFVNYLERRCENLLGI
ncbi:aminoglycoside phosphotransferase [Segniliparus rotundus DSM 44985]|uniref:Aminoglycoside phosphotransferase n=1 Tax=Segniliparus rotundus (strain ATCC BAA-972 / CDC 1076 / CIP 108378 / DSM 44985 / JCM 13578) TaxID=640132 RepID=D6ZD03_SEGRD|nr:phosphotransferase family protein [Segniliparus rotundus]ADG99190.1 aminoglycoside phosphotransferase [Segniliparus rotundus DSM 44985]